VSALPPLATELPNYYRRKQYLYSMTSSARR
jgi:hypothetical protein